MRFIMRRSNGRDVGLLWGDCLLIMKTEALPLCFSRASDENSRHIDDDKKDQRLSVDLRVENDGEGS